MSTLLNNGYLVKVSTKWAREGVKNIQTSVYAPKEDGLIHREKKDWKLKSFQVCFKKLEQTILNNPKFSFDLSRGWS